MQTVLIGALPTLLLAALAGCGQTTPTPPAAPADHTPAFVDEHRALTGCDDCHGVDACVRCHRARPPADHRPGFVGAPHGIAARLDADRCATCHTGPLCGRCHGL